MQLTSEARYCFLRHYWPYNEPLGFDLCKPSHDKNNWLYNSLLLCKANIPAVKRLLENVRLSEQNDGKQNIFHLNRGRGAKVYVSSEIKHLILQLYRPLYFGILVGSFQRSVPEWLLELSNEATELVIEEETIILEFANLLQMMRPNIRLECVIDYLNDIEPLSLSYYKNNDMNSRQTVNFDSLLKHKIQELDLSLVSIKTINCSSECPVQESVRCIHLKCPPSRLSKASKKLTELKRIIPKTERWILHCDSNKDILSEENLLELLSRFFEQLLSCAYTCSKIVPQSILQLQFSANYFYSNIPHDFSHLLFSHFTATYSQAKLYNCKSKRQNQELNISFKLQHLNFILLSNLKLQNA
ncbi:hypothetical protein M3Y95_00131400 [Aphelenchoides besseyi]|nr:hypothetical protein M3Y95_00131400 [Aphelenchoides besseyi]